MARQDNRSGRVAWSFDRHGAIPFQEWCKLRGISRSTGYRLMNKGEIKTFTIGARRFVTWKADQEFMSRVQGE